MSLEKHGIFSFVAQEMLRRFSDFRMNQKWRKHAHLFYREELVREDCLQLKASRTLSKEKARKPAAVIPYTAPLDTN